MNFIKSWLFLFLGISLNTIYTRAQEDSALIVAACHCTENLAPAGVMISHLHPKSEGMASYRYMNMGMNGIISGKSQVDEMDVFNNYIVNSDKMRMDMHMLMGMYGITDRLTAMFMLNYNVNTMNMEMLSVHDHDMSGMDNHSSTEMTMQTNGIGDYKLYLMYGLIKKINHQLIISSGVNFPLGSIQVLGSEDDMLYPGTRLPYNMQLGSGTFDVMPGLNYTFQKRRIAFGMQVSSIIRASTNVNGYRHGNEIGVSSWIAWNYWNNLSNSIRIDGNSTAIMHGKDDAVYAFNEISANPLNYGGQRMNVYLGLAYNFQKGLLKNNRLSAEYGLPVYQYVNGIQMKAGQAIMVSWSYSFFK